MARRKPRPPVRYFRPRVELLEDRSSPTAIGIGAAAGAAVATSSGPAATDTAKIAVAAAASSGKESTHAENTSPAKSASDKAAQSPPPIPAYQRLAA